MTATEFDRTDFSILIVDDTPDNLRLLVGLLSEQGYKVRPVTSGKMALSAAQGIPPDLILLDINMPGMDGYQVCEQLKANERTRDIPVIFLSALNDVFDKVQAFAIGGIDYITKPFQVEEVLARISTHLAMRSLQHRLQQKNQDLEHTLYELQTTQAQLIQSEKMAVLGQLVANVAHEMNTPLGAICSSAANIALFFNHNLEALPQFLQSLSLEQQQDFFTLLKRSAQSHLTSLSSKEKRQYKRNLIQHLEDHDIADADTIADTLIDIGIYDNIDLLLPLLRDPNSRPILKMTYELVSVHKSAQMIITASDRATKVVQALKSYAHHDSTGTKVQANLIDGIETALMLYHNQLKHGVEVIRQYTDLPSILCFPDDLNQVWTNLIQNALQAMNYKGTLTILLTHVTDQVTISITDTGSGIAPEIQAKIFDPFFTTKAIGEGNGLGLSIAKRNIEKHHGTITVSSIPGQTTFVVSLPLQ
ncbi:response regulator [Pantanalinema sp. GBBB05]|uniref:response regulator n=1 Tax=Pantanalinema sp. GBBB05 TaxID=2604139 RepID=UPI001DA30AA3|nr:response regulator [Pantanalinema sp. GBBB05]